jgi:2-polyprenyl-6-methoxyphenol hydroxylase-like FAD-dependent oxidoreductase
VWLTNVASSSHLTAAIVGAGPAGGMAALLLSRRGWQVTLIEQSRFPRDKVCGECVSALGMAVLERAGLKEPFLAAGAVRLTHALLHPPSGQPAIVPLPRPMWGLSRGALDDLLLEAARQAGATIRQPARCESLAATGTSSPFDKVRTGPTLRIRDLTSNRIEDLKPAWALVADGKAALCGPKGRAPAATGDFGIKAHFERVAGPRDAIELFSTLGTYGGVAAIEAGRWNAAFSVPGTMLREHRGDIAALFERLVASNPALGRRLAGARRVGPWLAAPLPRFAVTRNWPQRVIPVGNAAAALEPIGGEGMGLAMRSAEQAVDALKGPAEFRHRRLRASYNALWMTRRAGCRAAAKAVSSAQGAPAIAELLRRHEWLGSFSLQLLGKSSLW